MNVNPLPLDQREAMIAELASGLGPRAHETLRGLSDGALRTIYADWQAHEAAALRSLSSALRPLSCTTPATPLNHD